MLLYDVSVTVTVEAEDQEDAFRIVKEMLDASAETFLGATVLPLGEPVAISRE